MTKHTIAVVVILILTGSGLYIASKNQTSNAENIETVLSPASATPGTVTSGENPQPGSTVHDQPVEPAAAAARKDLAIRLGMETKNIVILSVKEATWNNGCLGLNSADEICTMALVDGFRVELLAKGTTYIYRTNQTGTQVRLETQ